MDSDNNNYEVIYCEDDGEYVYCNVCDKLCIEQFYKNHLKSQTHTSSFYKRQNQNNFFSINLFINKYGLLFGYL